MRILVVDDDELVRTVCIGMLKALKHDAVGVSGGQDAVTLLAQGHDCDLMILDESMPGLSGLATLRELHARNLCRPYLICTGRLQPEAPDSREGIPAPLAVLNKPFTLQRLQQVLAIAVGK